MKRLRMIVCVTMLALSAFVLGQNANGTANQGMTRSAYPAPSGPTDLQLLSRTDVQADLQFTTAQKSRLDGVNQKITRQWENGAKHHQTVATSGAVISGLLAEADREADAILNAEQMKRLGQIRVQLRGNMILLDPAVQKQLGFSDEQKSQVTALEQRLELQTRERLRSGSFQAGAFQRSQAEFSSGLAKLLTADQSSKLKELSGKPFHQ